MLRRIRFYNARGTDPYENLAVEAALLESVASDACVLYLWQNRRTVVIGRNQNVWQECKVEALQRDGGCLARRLSGGGAVFQDTGNLNFTFLLPVEAFDLARQQEVVLRAVARWGVRAVRTGRNDIEADGRKFSGNAFYHADGRSYHHGTLLVQADLEDLTRYLRVSEDKLRSKGVASVRARVVNLAALAPQITVETLRASLVEAFGEVYGLEPEALPLPPDSARVHALREKFASQGWLYGHRIPLDWTLSKRFGWGGMELAFHVESGVVRQAAAFSDALEAQFVAALPEAFAGRAFTAASLGAAAAALAATESERRIARDLTRWLEENL